MEMVHMKTRIKIIKKYDDGEQQIDFSFFNFLTLWIACYFIFTVAMFAVGFLIGTFFGW